MTGITESSEYLELVRRDIDEYNAFPMAKYFYSYNGFSSPARSTGFCEEFRRWSSVVDVSSHHVRFHRNPTYHPKPEEIQRRGAISSFSRHSRLRLREALANASLSASDVFGVTLTVPWKNLMEPLSDTLYRYRECFNRFGVYFRRKYPFSAAIFRHELQRRKMPHCHLVVFFSMQDVKGRGLQDLRREVFDLWLRSLNGFLGGGSLLAFSRHGVKVDRLSDRDAMFRYISDHASKSKQAQLGYKGKQWGYIKKSLLSNRVKISYRFKFQSDIYFFHISKACRFFIKAPCVFGKKLSRDLDGVSIQFVKGSTVRQIVRYIERDHFAVIRLPFRSPRRWKIYPCDFSVFSVSPNMIHLCYNFFGLFRRSKLC